MICHRATSLPSIIRCDRRGARPLAQQLATRDELVAMSANDSFASAPLSSTIHNAGAPLPRAMGSNQSRAQLN
jgi:hypothetical protein